MAESLEHHPLIAKNRFERLKKKKKKANRKKSQQEKKANRKKENNVCLTIKEQPQSFRAGTPETRTFGLCFLFLQQMGSVFSEIDEISPCLR